MYKHNNKVFLFFKAITRFGVYIFTRNTKPINSCLKSNEKLHNLFKKKSLILNRKQIHQNIVFSCLVDSIFKITIY